MRQPRFGEQGLKSSDGLEVVAETGATSKFEGEMEALKSGGTVGVIDKGSGVGISPGSTTVDFKASSAFPVFSIVTMLAPSPDWFVGIAGVPLADASGPIASQSFDLILWDAGTDLTEAYTGDKDGGDRVIKPVTTPAKNTDFENGVARGTGKFLGTMKIERL